MHLADTKNRRKAVAGRAPKPGQRGSRRWRKTRRRARLVEARRTADLMIKEWGGPTQKLDVWIDEKGLILREQMPMRFKEAGRTFKAKMVVHFLDIGRPQQIDTPEDREVVDLTDKAADELGRCATSSRGRGPRAGPASARACAWWRG